jgi:hypothetical protein
MEVSLKTAFIAAMLISAAASAGTVDLFTEIGTGFAMGGGAMFRAGG